MTAARWRRRFRTSPLRRGLQSAAPAFTDITNHWAKADIEFVAARGLLSGTGNNLFSPDGCSIPIPLAAVTFSDSEKISAWAAKQVTAMQRAGIIRGKDGNRFDPQGNATRAEGSAVLRRFVKIVIDPTTATGWAKNDSGHWLYYQGGKALTGWQSIGKLRYYFNADGVMHEGWKQDTSTGKWYYWTNAGAATSWREMNGKWYYFDEDGVMAVNTEIDGYEIGPDGARKEK